MRMYKNTYLYTSYKYINIISKMFNLESKINFQEEVLQFQNVWTK